MTTYQKMMEWKAYSDTFNAGASWDELKSAALAMKDSANRTTALINLGIMTDTQKKQVEARWNSINNVTEKEMATHCQFAGLNTLK